MGLSSDVSFDIASAAICGVLIVCRCLYRLLFTCKLHPTCHRRWRVDDAYMALALVPLVSRTVTIVTSFLLNPEHSSSPPTEEEAAARGLSVDQLAADRVVSRKLLIPGRISYALLCVNFSQSSPFFLLMSTISGFGRSMGWLQSPLSWDALLTRDM